MQFHLCRNKLHISSCRVLNVVSLSIFLMFTLQTQTSASVQISPQTFEWLHLWSCTQRTAVALV